MKIARVKDGELTYPDIPLFGFIVEVALDDVVYFCILMGTKDVF